MSDAASRPGIDERTDHLARATSLVAGSADLDATLGGLLEAGAILGPIRAAIYLHDPDRASAELAAALEVERAGGSSGPPVEGNPALEVIRTREAALDRRDAAGHRHLDLPLVVAHGTVDDVVGVLTIEFGPSHEVADADTVFATALAHLAAVAVDRARLASLVAERSEWYERMAHSDPLTGLANQRTFGRVLELELARAGRQGGEVSVAVFDVDGFVETNATAGREAGDDVLRAVAVVLNESVRLVDTVARFGGDEFIVVAPGSAGTTVAQRVLDGVAALEAVGGRPVSVSAGVARFPVDGTTADELVDAALRALAGARERGAGTLEETSRQPAG